MVIVIVTNQGLRLGDLGGRHKLGDAFEVAGGYFIMIFGGEGKPKIRFHVIL